MGLKLAAAAVVASGICTQALAQDPSPHLCVGVGATAREQAANTPYTLKLVYAEPDGHYLADVLTRIEDVDGVFVLDVACDGPWLLVDLPAGVYQVTSTFSGETKTLSVTVDGDVRQEILVTF